VFRFPNVQVLIRDLPFGVGLQDWLLQKKLGTATNYQKNDRNNGVPAVQVVHDEKETGIQSNFVSAIHVLVKSVQDAIELQNEVDESKENNGHLSITISCLPEEKCAGLEEEKEE
jgi:hypothetical protein